MYTLLRHTGTPPHHRHRGLASGIRTLLADEKIEVKNGSIHKLEQGHMSRKSGSESETAVRKLAHKGIKSHNQKKSQADVATTCNSVVGEVERGGVRLVGV